MKFETSLSVSNTYT